ncbi:MAG: hypothetical protein BECKG1743F_GA0114225_108933, partial [Candidatus Kentron sp. G]
LDTFGAQVFSDHERYPADVKCLSLLYLYVGRYPRNNASRNTQCFWRISDFLAGNLSISPALLSEKRPVPLLQPAVPGSTEQP